MVLMERLFPGLAAKRYLKLTALKNAQRLYQAAGTSQYHPRKGDERSGNAVMEHARGRVGQWARYLEENHDLAVGALDDLTDRVVGSGIVVAPLPKLADGTVYDPLAQTMRKAWQEWGRNPEVSQVVPWGELQRLVFRTNLRDGEVLAKHLPLVSGYSYPGPVPYAIEALEADYLPFDRMESDPKIIHGIERDRWGTVVAYHLLEDHPGDYLVPLSAASLAQKTVRYPASVLTHLRVARRLGQLRGISVFHSCVHRLQDLKEYEESERLAARIAASFAAAITKSPDAPGRYDLSSANKNRSFEMAPAMIFDNLLPGESVETIDSNRPSNALPDFRSSMLKAVSAGTGARYSTIARTWDSSYTAMRQETVSTMPGTDRMQDYFVSRFVRPVYELWVRSAIAAGVFDIRGIDETTLFDADYRGPGIPWIDPLDEAKANVLSMQYSLKSRRQIIRETGGDPATVDQEIEMDGGPPPMTGEADEQRLETESAA